jgi:hypothetical protein
MSVNPITFISQVTSDAGATVEGDPVYVGSQPVEVQLHGPGNLHNIQMSQDRINWGWRCGDLCCHVCCQET